MAALDLKQADRHGGSNLKLMGVSRLVQDQGQCEQELDDEGLMDDAFEFIISNEGLTTEANYPYTAVDGICNAEKTSKITVYDYEDVPASLLKAVASQPVSVAIDASGNGFRFFQGDRGTELDHGVTAVGYGTAPHGTKYWIVKNSWGTSWGEDRYIRMKRGVSAKEGLCGIAMEASYPTADS